MQHTHTHSGTKRRTPLKAETHTDTCTSALLVRGTSCQSWCGGQDEDSLPDSQDVPTIGDTQRTTPSLCHWDSRVFYPSCDPEKLLTNLKRRTRPGINKYFCYGGWTDWRDNQ